MTILRSWTTRSAQAIALIAPVALILVAENLGHLKAVGAMTGRDMTPFVGRAFMGDGVATLAAASVGGLVLMAIDRRSSDDARR